MRGRGDALTLGLVGVGALLLAAALVGVVVLLQPVRADPEPATQPARQSLTPTLPADRVATVLRVDAAAGAGTVAQVGDRVDVLGYFPKQVTGAENVTRLLLADVPVLAVTKDGNGAGLTLAVPQATALLLHEAQALGARPFVVLRSAAGGATYPPSLSDSDLAERLSSPFAGREQSGGN
jgi:Flp pilus assembly protein CpaB